MDIARFTWAALFTALCFSFGSSVQSQTNQVPSDEIVLRSFDGFTQLRGKLLEFDGSTYTIETVLGVIKVDGLQVNCEGEGCPQNLLFGAEFGVHGSNTMGVQLMPVLIEGYADSLDATLVTELGSSEREYTLRIMHEDGREMAAIDMEAYGSSTGFRDLGARRSEVAMSSRRLIDSDLPGLSPADIPDLRDTANEQVIALDGLVVITHPENPIKSVSLEDLALMFSGAVANWSQIGGPDLPVTLYALDDEFGTFQTFDTLVLRPYDVGIAATAQRLTSSTQLSDSVAADLGGIGITSLAFQRATRRVPIRQECGILSYPTSFGVKTEEYPLARRLYFYTPPAQIAAHARAIIDFALSKDAQPLIEEAGFVSQSLEALSVNDQGSRLVRSLVGPENAPINQVRDMFRELGDAERLSLALRFTPGSSELEPKSARDAQRLAEDLAEGGFAGREILLVGFTDSAGQFEVNRGLSLRRAAVVEEAMRASVPAGALDDVQITLLGFGEMSPVGCNTTFRGRTVNRRVEVWVRDR